MKIIFTGAQGTGKTSVMDALPDTFNKIRGITRNIIKEKKLTVNEYSDNASQTHIFNAYEHQLVSTDNYIAERGLIDVYAYTMSRVKAGKCSQTIAETQLSKIEKFNTKNPDVIYIYFPIEFDIVEDGVRSMNKDFQKEIDEIIHTTLLKTGCNYFSVSGTVEQRVSQILNIIDIENEIHKQ
jgi:predicted ATPase